MCVDDKNNLSQHQPSDSVQISSVTPISLVTKLALWQGEFLNILNYFLPTTQGLKLDIDEDAEQVKKIIENVRTSMKAEAKSLKNLVDEVTSENIKHI